MIQSTFGPLKSLLTGARLCFRDLEIRRLAVRPWLIAGLTYLAGMIAAFAYHDDIVATIVSSPSGFWGNTLYLVVWIAAAAGLLVASVVISIIAALVIGGIFQTDIALIILRRSGFPLPPPKSGVTGTLEEVGRTVRNESLKLLWIVPLVVVLFFFGLIPIFTVPVAILGAWLIAYSSFDIVLDAIALPAGTRLGFAVRNAPMLIVFGLFLMLAGVVPFVGFLLPPVAVAGAAELLAARPEIVPTRKT